MCETGAGVAGWPEALEALVRDRGAALVAYGCLLTGDRREAEDLFQDALVKTFARPARDVLAAEKYVRRTILTTYIDGFRRRKHWVAIRHLVAHDEPEPADPAAQAEARVDVATALRELTPRQRACVVLRHFDDLPLSDIAAALGVTEGAVKRYLFDATRALEARLGPLGERVRDEAETADVTLRRTR